MTSQQEHGTAPSATRDGGTGTPRLGNPLLPGLIAAAAAFAFVVARWATWAHHNLANFILVGRLYSNPAQLPPGIPVQPTWGYDGQYYYRLALNPANLAKIAYGIRVDRSYRFMRIGYPAVTWLLSFGQHSLVPAMLIAVNVAAVGVMGYFGGVLARQGGRHVLWGLLIVTYFGLVTSVARDTAEPLGAAFLLAGLVALRARRPWAAGLMLACGALTRETVMVAVAAIGVVRVITLLRTRRRPGRDDLPWVLPSVVFAAWQLVILAVTGSLAVASDGSKNAGAPFTAPLHALVANLQHISTASPGQYDLWLAEFFGLALALILATAALRVSRAASWEKLALYLYVVEICLVTPTTWSSLDADMRSFIEVYLFAVVILLSVPAGRLGARFGWALPVLAAWMILAVALVVQRRLTMSFQALRRTLRSAARAAPRQLNARRSMARPAFSARQAAQARPGPPSVSCP